MPSVFRYDGRRLVPAGHDPVREFPVALTVNGVELATLIASPHDLTYLVAGFLRMQGLVRNADDFLVLSVCEEFGSASVRIRGEVPPRLKPTLTSGCGTGITFDLPGSRPVPNPSTGEGRSVYAPDDLFFLMSELARRADAYRSHGGIHSAAVGDGRSLLLYAEDLGRHNTIDRIAGEALLKKVDLTGMILVASGRVSSEMAAKAAALGISVIASRTSPTDMAVRICEESGIALAGYVRGGRFNVYAHAERIAAVRGDGKVPGVTGILLAGGASSRMGRDKALLPYRGGRLVEAAHAVLAGLFGEVLLVTNTPDRFPFLSCAKVADLFSGRGALAGIHSGLVHSANPAVFAVACDMPSLDPALIRHLATDAGGEDAVVPESDTGAEPLHALYRKSAVPAIEETLKSGERRIVSALGRMKVRRVAKEEVARFDPAFRSFRNVNTPAEYEEMRAAGSAAGAPGGQDAGMAGRATRDEEGDM